MQVNYANVKPGEKFRYLGQEYIKTNKHDDRSAYNWQYAVNVNDGSMISILGIDEVTKINPNENDIPYTPPPYLW